MSHSLSTLVSQTENLEIGAMKIFLFSVLFEIPRTVPVEIFIAGEILKLLRNQLGTKTMGMIQNRHSLGSSIYLRYKYSAFSFDQEIGWLCRSNRWNEDGSIWRSGELPLSPRQ